MDRKYEAGKYPPNFDESKWRDFVEGAFIWESNKPMHTIFSCEKDLRKFLKTLNGLMKPGSKPIRMRDIEKHITRNNDGSVVLTIGIKGR